LLIALIVLIVYGHFFTKSTSYAEKKSNEFKRLGKKFIFFPLIKQTLSCKKEVALRSKRGYTV